MKTITTECRVPYADTDQTGVDGDRALMGTGPGGAYEDDGRTGARPSREGHAAFGGLHFVPSMSAFVLDPGLASLGCTARPRR